MPRDNLTPWTREMLGQSAGFNCVRPGCAKPTTALNLHADTVAGIGIGIAAHDSAASPGGPRFNEELTPEQRALWITALGSAPRARAWWTLILTAFLRGLYENGKKGPLLIANKGGICQFRLLV